MGIVIIIYLLLIIKYLKLLTILVMVGIKQIYISLLLFWTSLYHLNIY